MNPKNTFITIIAVLITAGFAMPPDEVRLLVSAENRSGFRKAMLGMTVAVPLIPLFLALIRSTTYFRFGTSNAAAISFCSLFIGAATSLFLLAQAEGAVFIALMHGVALTLGLAGSLAFMAQKPFMSGIGDFAVMCLSLSAAAAIWSLVHAGGLIVQTNKLVNDQPFCLGRNFLDGPKTLESYPQLRGFAIYLAGGQPAPGAQSGLPTILSVLDEKGQRQSYLWKPLSLQFVPMSTVPEMVKQPNQSDLVPVMLATSNFACDERADFWQTLALK
ncbi:MAG: hypothetical protein ACI853_000081 [Paracoccaceae bacterium]